MDRKRKWDDKAPIANDNDNNAYSVTVDIPVDNSHVSFIKSSLFTSLLRNKLQLHPADQFNLAFDKEKICITASSSEIVKLAEIEVQNVLKTGQFTRPLTNSNSIVIDVPLGFEYSQSYTSFLRGKLLGPQGSFLKHIQSTTQTKVQLRGKGSGFIELKIAEEAEAKALYLRVEGSDSEKVEEAKQLCQDLIATVKADYDSAILAKASTAAPVYTPQDYAAYQQYWAAYHYHQQLQQQAYAAQYYQNQQQNQDQRKP